MQKLAKKWKITVIMISMCAAGIIGAWIPGVRVKAADNTETYGDYQYTVQKDDTIKITKYTGSGGDVVIPDTIESKKVTVIGDSAFFDCKSLTGITIPSGVTSIGGDNPIGGLGAFYGCSSLTEIKLPSGVTCIGSRAFSGCSGLTAIEIPSGVTSIGEFAFFDCSGLTGSIKIPDGVTSIGARAFFGCSSLTEIEIPDGVTSIERGAFYGCSGLTEIEIPSGVTSIGDSAFCDCSGLTAINISDGVTSIERGAFLSCSGLTAIEIPSSVTDIGEAIFAYCPSDMVVYAEAGSYADTWVKGKGCYTVVNAAMPEKGSSEPMAEGTKITMGAQKCELMALPYDGETPKVTYVKSNDSVSASITVPDTVTVGGITYKVTGIEDGAFSDCTFVEEVVLPAPLEAIGEDAFEQVVSAEEETEKKLNVKIPEGLENVEKLGLENITNVINIIFYVPEGSNAQLYLNQCENVTIIIYQSGQKPDTGDDPDEKQEPPEESKQPDTGDNPGGKQEPSTEEPKQPDTGDNPGGKQEPPTKESEQKPEISKTYTVKDLTYKVTSSQNVSFAGAGKKTMKKLTIPQKVTILGQSFKVTAVEKGACKKYKKLETVVIGSNVKTIGDEAFMGCSKLKKITIGKNVTTIGKKALYGDKKCVRIIFKGARVKKIGKRALYNVPKRAKITAPKKAQKKYMQLLNAAK